MFDLVLELLKTRKNNRREVFTEFVLPLQHAVQELHANYLTGFEELIERISIEGITESVARAVEAHLLTRTSDRHVIAAEFAAVQRAASKKLDIERPSVEAYLKAVAAYLGGERSETFLEGLELSGFVVRPNPNYDRIRLSLEDGPAERRAVVEVISQIRTELQQAFALVAERFGATKTRLLA